MLLLQRATSRGQTRYCNRPSSIMDWTPSLWMETFEKLLYDYEDEWSLSFGYSQTATVTKQQRKKGWKVYCCHAHGNNTWTSARVVVLFRYRLRGKRGAVIMRPFGQACRRCDDDEFDLPGFSKKEVEQALLRLIRKIRKNCYGDVDDDDHGSARKLWDTKPHEADLCQACIMGICCQDDK